MVDLNKVNPIDWYGIYSSVEKTLRLIALDTGYSTGSVSAEIIARVAINRTSKLKCVPVMLTMLGIPEQTTLGPTKESYIRADEIAKQAMKMLDKNGEVDLVALKEPELHDVPVFGLWALSKWRK